MKKTLLLLVAIFSLATATSSVKANPRFAFRTGLRCENCHVNPTGSLLRKEYGVNYGRDEITFEATRDYNQLKDFSNQLAGGTFSFGTDIRLAYNVQPDTTSRNAFTQQEVNLYAGLRVNKALTLAYTYMTGGSEFYGLAHSVLPLNGFVKLGQFIPHYGIKTYDHFVVPTDFGLELGIQPGIFNLTLGAFNGSGGASDNDTYKAFNARAEAILDAGDVKFNVGASGYTNRTGGRRQFLYGGFGAVSFLERFTLWADANLILEENIAAGDANARHGRLLTAEFYALVITGVDLRLTYNFLDSDIEVLGDASSQVIIGVEFFPLAGLELQPQFVINTGTSNISTNQFNLIFHFYL
ncbi:MAG: hypothetical protein IAF08_07295 [Rhizobacter sp.]|nr:hypothetical protein [Chlorobiales bacterium]